MCSLATLIIFSIQLDLPCKLSRTDSQLVRSAELTHVDADIDTHTMWGRKGRRKNMENVHLQTPPQHPPVLCVWFLACFPSPPLQPHGTHGPSPRRSLARPRSAYSAAARGFGNYARGLGGRIGVPSPNSEGPETSPNTSGQTLGHTAVLCSKQVVAQEACERSLQESLNSCRRFRLHFQG